MERKVQSAPPTACQVFSYRWVNFVAYSLITFLAGLGMASLPPMFAIMAGRWKIGLGAAAMTMTVLTIWQVLLSLPAGWLTNKIGFRGPVIIGGFLLAAGYFMRSTVTSYNAFLLWCTVAGIGWGLIWSPEGCMLANWFPFSELGMVNSIGLIGLTVGQAVGSMTVVGLSVSMGWNQVWRLYGIVSIVLSIAAALLLKEKPALPPSPRPPIKPAGIMDGIKQTMNRVSIPLQYVVLVIVGSIAVVPSLLVPMLMGAGIAPSMAGVIAGMGTLGGIVGSFIIPPFAFKSHKVKETMLVGSVITPLAFLIIFLVPPGSALVITILGFLVGFFGLPVMGLSIGIGQTQPGVNPGNAAILAGVFLTSIGLGAAIIPQVVTRLIDATGSAMAGVWGEVILLAISFVLILLFVPAGPPKGEAAGPHH
jgi:MFS family permease